MSRFIPVTLACLVLTIGLSSYATASVPSPSDEHQGLKNNNLNQSSNVNSLADKFDNSSSANMLAYENSLLGFKMQYPADWQVEHGSDLVLFFSPKENSSNSISESFEVALFPSKRHSTEELFEVGHDHIRNLPNLTILEQYSNVSIDGNSAYAVVYSYDDSVYGPLKGYEITTVNDEPIYILTYLASLSTYEKNHIMMHNIINSFHFTNSRTAHFIQKI